MSRIIGVLETVAGALLALYIAAWAIGFVRWSADIAFAAMGALALFLLIDGISRIRRRKSALAVKSKVLNFLSQTVLLALASVMVFTQIVIWNGCRETTDTAADYAVIFGAKIYGRMPSVMLEGRIYAAAQYLLENPGTVAIACGGYSDGDSYSEAQVIRDGLVARGVDESRIILEDGSTDSRQSAENAAEIIRQRGGGTVTAITSDYHLYRCKRLFENAGFEVYGRSYPISAYLRPIAHFREMLSVIRDYALDFIKII